MEIRFKKFPHYGELPLPKYHTDGSSGMDLRAAIESSVNIGSGQKVIIPCGIAIELSPGFEGQIRGRSGLAAKHWITVLNSPGTVDNDFRGELQVILINHGPKAYLVRRGDRIAQLVICPVAKATSVWVMPEGQELTPTARDMGGHGSTGRI